MCQIVRTRQFYKEKRKEIFFVKRSMFICSLVNSKNFMNVEVIRFDREAYVSRGYRKPLKVLKNTEVWGGE